MAFAGYAAVFDVVDRAGDVMRRGAFADARVVPLLWQHRGVAVGTLSLVGEDVLDRVLVRVGTAAPGDVLLMAVGPGQGHLGIRTAAGFVHADAALRRVVERPGLPPWPLIGVWRMEV